MRARKVGLATGGLAGFAALLLGGGVHAQLCGGVDCSSGAVLQNDDCAANPDPDPNGGCNFVPAQFQHLGTLTSTIEVCGAVGTYGASSRDLDWYTFTLTSPAYVRVRAHHGTDGGVGGPATNFTIFIRNGSDCDTAVTEYAAASGTCPFVTPLVLLPAGTHTVILTVNSFAPNPPACDVAYVAYIDRFDGGASCFSSTNDCLADNATPGCSVFSCCAFVCDPLGGLPSCCDTAWDQFCADYADLFCNIFVYNCDAPVVANDCATDAETLLPDTVVAFDNTGANTDGPVTNCDYGADLWWKVLAPDSGEMTVTVNSPGWDSTIAIYALGTSPTFDPQELPNLLIGCVDVQGEGGEVAVLLDAEGGEYYLIQIGGWAPGGIPEQGAGDLEVNFRRLIFNTGNTNPVQFSSGGTCVYSLVNLGWSSGKVSGAFQQRWTAAAFTVPDPGPGSSGWKVERIHVYGFTPAAVTNQTMVYRIYSRSDFVTAPTDATLVASGSVPFPVPYDIAGGAANENHELAVDIDLPAGDYWLTVYADNDQGPSVFANFAWFTNAANAIPTIGLGPDPDQAFQWRSTTYPVPGYGVYTLPDCTLAYANGIQRYSPGFRILGTKLPLSCASNGSADFNNSGCVDGSDLGTLLGLWGPGGGLSVADLDCSGIVDGADLGTLLGQWGCN